VGEIRNDSAATVENVVVRVTFLRDDLLGLTSATAEVYAPRLAAGQTAPFRVAVDQPDEYDSAVVSVSGWGWATTAPLPPLATPQNLYQSSDTRVLLGRVVNTTASPIHRVRVIATFRDASGAVTNVVESGLGSDSPYGLTLAPGGGAPFRLLAPFGPTSGTVQYSLMYEVAPNPAPPPLPTRSVRADRASNHIDVWGEIQNTTGGPIREAQVIASFYDANNRLVNADWVWVSQNADRILNADQRAPFQISLDGPDANTWRRYELQTFHRTAPAPLPGGVSLETTVYQVSLDYQTLTLRGRVVNTTTGALHQPRLVVTFLKDGAVQYALSAELEVAEGLAPGAGINYVISHPLPSDVGVTLQGVEAVYAVDFQP
jgi:hypothetical protein